MSIDNVYVGKLTQEATETLSFYLVLKLLRTYSIGSTRLF